MLGSCKRRFVCFIQTQRAVTSYSETSIIISGCPNTSTCFAPARKLIRSLCFFITGIRIKIVCRPIFLALSSSTMLSIGGLQHAVKKLSPTFLVFINVLNTYVKRLLLSYMVLLQNSFSVPVWNGFLNTIISVNDFLGTSGDKILNWVVCPTLLIWKINRVNM